MLRSKGRALITKPCKASINDPQLTVPAAKPAREAEELLEPEVSRSVCFTDDLLCRLAKRICRGG
jgi:hypothetical protein